MAVLYVNNYSLSYFMLCIMSSMLYTGGYLSRQDIKCSYLIVVVTGSSKKRVPKFWRLFQPQLNNSILRGRKGVKAKL